MTSLALTPESGMKGPLSASGVSTKKVYEKLKQLLIGYHFRPGEKLVVAALAEAMCVSGTPVREALGRLQAEGLLILVPNKGYYAKALSIKEMRELLEYLCVLLTSCLKRAKKSEPDGNELRHQSMQTGPGTPVSQSPEQLADFIEQTFRLIAGLSENREIAKAVKQVSERTHLVRILEVRESKRRCVIQREMMELSALLQAGAFDKGASILHRQFSRQLKILPTLVKDGLGQIYDG